ncbi:MAG: hypothetical protein EOO73_15895 [Myxococcales bacterium]|nr:MAG: hypothetical protein EOO73_15895 [Myxococcales bacterium]
MRRSKLLLCASFSLLTSLACSKQPPPLTAPSGEQPGYAEQYPSRLTALRTRFAEDEAKVQAALPQLEPAAQKLGNADPATVKELFELADETGKSQAYADQSLEAETVSRFWDEEKQPLHQKIAGAVSYQSKQKQCSKECGDDLAGVAAGASDRAVEKQLEERQQRVGELHRYVEDHEEQLGKPNVDAAEKQAGAIAQLSHLTYVRLEMYRRELEAALNDSSDVGSTLDRTQKDADAVLADAQASKSRKALAEKRKASASAAKAALDAEVQQARQALADMEQRQKKLIADYEKSFGALTDALEQKAKK